MRRRQSRTDVSLFPFLSVLCSVIGVLVLFIVLVLSTRVVIEEEKFQETEAYRRKPRPGAPDLLEEGLDESTYEAMRAELTRLRESLDLREAERNRLIKRLAALEDLLATKKTELLLPRVIQRRPRELDKPQPVAVVPDPDPDFQVTLKPTMIEVSSHGYTIYPGQTSFSPISYNETDNSDIKYDVDAEFSSWLKKFERRHEKEYLVLLIHPNGVDAYRGLRLYLLDNHEDIQLGYEPFSREWVLTESNADADDSS